MKYRKNNCFRLGMVFTFFLCTSACSLSLEPLNFDKDKRSAETLVTRFHVLYNQNNSGGMYALFTAEGRDRTTLQEFSQQSTAFHLKAGNVKNSRLLRWDVRVVGGARIVNLYYQTEFEKFTKIEEFDIKVNGEEAVIDFYGHTEALPANSK